MHRFLIALVGVLLVGGCAQPRALSDREVHSDAALSEAARHVVPMFTANAYGDDGMLSGDIASIVVLPGGRGLTAAHCIEDEDFRRADDPDSNTIELTIDGETHRFVMSSLGLVGSRTRSIVIEAEGDADDHARDWAVLAIDWEGAPEGEPVREVATPAAGEVVYLVGYPSAYLPAGWDRGIPYPDRPTPTDSDWAFPEPTVIVGRMAPPNRDWGMVVDLPGMGGMDLAGLSGGGAFVRRGDRMALIGLVTRAHWSPLFRSVVLAPIPPD